MMWLSDLENTINTKPEPKSDIIEKLISIVADDNQVDFNNRMVKLNSTIHQRKKTPR